VALPRRRDFLAVLYLLIGVFKICWHDFEETDFVDLQGPLYYRVQCVGTHALALTGSGCSSLGLILCTIDLSSMKLYPTSYISVTRKFVASSTSSRLYHVRKAPEPASSEVVQLLESFASHTPLPISLATLLSFGRPLTSQSILDSVSYVRHNRLSDSCKLLTEQFRLSMKYPVD
jgi:hypothetical protein